MTHWKLYFMCMVIMWSPLYATTHDAGEIYTEVDTVGDSFVLRWPFQTNPNADDQLFSKDLLLGHSNAVTFSYSVDSSQPGSFSEPGEDSSEETNVFTLASVGGTNLGVEVSVKTFDSSYGLLTNVVEYEYIITNNSTTSIDAFYAGKYFDFDLGSSISDQRFGYDDARRMYYQFIDSGGTYVGVRVVSGEAHSAHFRAFGDNFNRSYASIADGVLDTNVESTDSIDVTMTLSQQFVNFNPGNSGTFVIAVIFGETLEDIQQASDQSFTRNAGSAPSSAGQGGGSFTVDVETQNFVTNEGTSGGGGCLLR